MIPHCCLLCSLVLVPLVPGNVVDCTSTNMTNTTIPLGLNNTTACPALALPRSVKEQSFQGLSAALAGYLSQDSKYNSLFLTSHKEFMPRAMVADSNHSMIG